MRALYEIAGECAEVRALLEEAERDEGSEENWVGALVETLDALEGELADRADIKLRVLLSLEAAAEVCANEKRRLAERATRLTTGASRIRAQLVEELERAGKPRLPCAIRTISVVRGRESVEIVDEREIPTQLTDTKVTPDKRAIGDALRAGEKVPGARLVRGASTIRLS